MTYLRKANNYCHKVHAPILCAPNTAPLYMAGENDERSPLLQNDQANGHEDRDEEVFHCSGLFS